MKARGTTRKSPILKTRKSSGKSSKAQGSTHGGAREGAGRKSDAAKAALERLREDIAVHGEEIVPIMEVQTDGTRKQIAKKKRTIAILDMFFTEAIEKKSIPAGNAYLDRTLGKAVQPIDHSGEIKSHEQYTPTSKAVLAAQAAFHAALAADDDA